MKNNFLKLIISLMLLGTGIIIGLNINRKDKTTVKSDESAAESVVRFDDTREIVWSEDFKIAEIRSSVDSSMQKAYFYAAKSVEPKPLVVSLHTWSGDFSQKDDLAKMCKERDLNYIHPDFRGANNTKDACCSFLALNDIDDAISYAKENANVDESKVYVIGVSGGGYATLSTFMKSRHKVKKFSAWASISDLIAWYNESKIRGNRYAENILNCTESENDRLNENIARVKSPFYWDTPVNKPENSSLFIYAGIYDGIQGSVPITHSINFYNKLLSDLSVKNRADYVSDEEKLQLLEFRKPLGEFGTMADRKICLLKESENIKLVIFEGNHEMLTEFALNELLQE
ncbi:MAG: prolyl oligopeptidase family serine peptidase [Prolixibacteraceae bacterium]|nr:prolyl oligopeptidase family serine peptidase [Prolixibacteraceae bacterium]